MGTHRVSMRDWGWRGVCLCLFLADGREDNIWWTLRPEGQKMRKRWDGVGPFMWP